MLFQMTKTNSKECKKFNSYWVVYFKVLFCLGLIKFNNLLFKGFRNSWITDLQIEFLQFTYHRWKQRVVEEIIFISNTFYGLVDMHSLYRSGCLPTIPQNSEKFMGRHLYQCRVFLIKLQQNLKEPFHNFKRTFFTEHDYFWLYNQRATELALSRTYFLPLC